MADELDAIIQRMIDAGEPEENIAAVIQSYEQDAARYGSVSSDEPGTYAGGFVKGMKEGMIGGAKGFVKNIIPDTAMGVVDTLKTPFTFARGMYDAAGGALNLANNPIDTVKQSYADVSNMLRLAPSKVSEAASSAARMARTDPEGFGAGVSSVTGQVEGALLTGKAAMVAPRPIARKVGHALSTVGEQGKWPIRMMGAHQLGSGNPAGVLTLALPEQLAKQGNRLERWGTPAGEALTTPHGQAVRIRTDISAAERSGDINAFTAVDDEITTKSLEIKGRLTGKMTDQDLLAADKELKALDRLREQAAAARLRLKEKAANARRLANNEATKAAMKPGPTSVTETTSAIDEGGNRSVQRTKYTAEGEEGMSTTPDSLDIEAELRKRGIGEPSIRGARENVKPTGVPQPMRPVASHAPSTPAAAAPIKPVASHRQSSGRVEAPASRSNDLSSVTGLSNNDLRVLGLDPTKIPAGTKLKFNPDVVQKILDMRQQRGMSAINRYYLEQQLKHLYNDPSK